MKLSQRAARAALVAGLTIAGVAPTLVEAGGAPALSPPAFSPSSRPSSPVISTIVTSSKAVKGKVDVTVTFMPAEAHPKSPVLGTQVKIGAQVCLAKARAIKCVLRKVPAGKASIAMARAKNKNGYGRWGKIVKFRTTPGSKWGADGVAAASLKFDLTSAVGLALRTTVSGAGVRKSATGSNLQVVSATGVISNAVVSGSALVGGFLIAPNDKVYVVFNSKTKVGSASCLLAEVAKATGEPACIESDLSQIAWPPPGSAYFTSEPLQFDDSGALYYAGIDSSGKWILRRYKDGVTTSLVTNNVNSLRFLTMPDGSVILGGSTSTSNLYWTRLVTTSGGLRTLVAGDVPTFLTRFPDGNAYIGFWGTTNFGVKRYLASSASIDTRYWISGNVNGVERSTFFDVGAAYDTPLRIPALEPYYGTMVKQFIRTSDDKVYAITGLTPTLVQYYPVVVQPATSVASVSVMEQIGNKLAIGGTDKDGLNITTLYDTATDTERVLIPATDEIEVYHLNHVASSNKIMFDGLRFADNTYVIGQIDLATGAVTAAPTGSSKLVDFQTFRS